MHEEGEQVQPAPAAQAAHSHDMDGEKRVAVTAA